MSKFDKILTFNHDGNHYFLCRILNYGNDSNELKFNFVNKKSSSGVIYTREALKLQDDDVITDYGEITYHSDGSVLWKHPRYPIKSKRIDNPKREGFRRIKLSKINNWEPVAKYDIFDYRVCEVKENFLKERAPKVHRFKNRNVFNGNSMSCLINLVNKNYEIPDFGNPTEVNERIPNITNNLDLWVIITNIPQKGNYLKLNEKSRPIFSRNNVVQIMEKNT